MQPYLFKAIYYPKIWGGESWQICGIPGMESIVAAGPEAGKTIRQIIRRHKVELMGEDAYARFRNEFPLLIKFIDAKDDLSVQVHPNDELAFQRHHCMGKSEIWYIVRAAEGAQIRVGLNRPITMDDYDTMVRTEVDGRCPLEDCIATYPSQPGDVFYLPAGRLHSIGAGNYLCEVQQTSDITYRVYDFCRRDQWGQTRPLHIEEAREAIDYRVKKDYRTHYDREARNSELIDSTHFRVNRIGVDGPDTIDLQTENFVCVIGIEGEMVVNGEQLTANHTLLVPACDNRLRVSGKGTILTATI